MTAGVRVGDRLGLLLPLKAAGRLAGRKTVSSAEARTQVRRGHFFPRDEYYMRLALREAERAPEHEDVPIGAVLVRDGEVLAAACNERELRSDPTAHAEVLVLREAGSQARRLARSPTRSST